MVFSESFTIQVVPTSSGELAVQWGGFTALPGHTVRLMRGFSNDAAEVVLANAETETLFIDTDLNIRHISVYPHYWLEAQGPVQYGGFSRSPKATLAGPVDKLFFTMADEFNKALRLVDGVPADILLVKRDTERCPNCWNFLQSARMGTASGEPCSCYGTGWKDGFWPPIKTMMRYMDNTVIGKLFAKFPVTEFDTQYTVQVSGYPYIQENDVLVDLLYGKRLRVVQVTTINYRQRIPLLQLVGADELPATDEAYLFQIPAADFETPRPLKQTSRVMW